jgi:ribosome assembly protein YihI (activator of Der GTPase)
VKRVRLEDDLFALTMDAQSSGEAESASIREKIRDKIAEIVNLDFSERQTRIEKLEKMLDDEKTRLAADQSSVDKIIDRRTDQIMNRLEGLNRELSSPTTRPTLTEEANENEAAPSGAAPANGAEVNVDSAVTSTPAQK